MYLTFELVCILSILILSVKDRGGGVAGGGGMLKGQNLLSVTKVICQQSLNFWLKILVDKLNLVMQKKMCNPLININCK